MTAADLVRLDQADAAWQDLLARAPDANIFHHPAWGQVLADTYGYGPIVLADPDGGAGALLARVRRPGGLAWVSLPFADHCSALATDPESLQRFTAGLAHWSRRQGVPVEVRGAVPPAADWRHAAIGVRQVRPLAGDDQSLRRGLAHDHRRRLREAERSGLRVRLGRSADDMADFYRLHVRTRRRQGVPVQPRRFFDAIWRHVIMPGMGVVALVGEPRRAIAAFVVFAWNGTAIGKFQPSEASCWKLRPNHLLYWAVIRWARDTGCTRFDFGRTEAAQAGLQRFKAGWGTAAIPLSYAHTGRDAAAAGDHRLLGAIMGHVIRRSPACVCRGLGALLYRYAA